MYEACMCVLLCLLDPLMAIACSLPSLSLDTVFPVNPIIYTCTHSCLFHYRTQWESNRESYKSEQHAAAPKGWTAIPDPSQNLSNNSEKGSAVLIKLTESRWSEKLLRLWELYFGCESSSPFQRDLFFLRMLSDFTGHYVPVCSSVLLILPGVHMCAIHSFQSQVVVVLWCICWSSNLIPIKTDIAIIFLINYLPSKVS